jgi:hypothetical protein
MILVVSRRAALLRTERLQDVDACRGHQRGGEGGRKDVTVYILFRRRVYGVDADIKG